MAAADGRQHGKEGLVIAERLHWLQTSPVSGRITTDGGHVLAGYTWSTAGGTHPCVHPLQHRDGAGPLTNYGPFDHPWHYGLWWSWKLINGMVFWENTERERQGGYAVDAFRGGTDGDGRVVIEQTARLRPHAEPDSAWLVEQRRLTARPRIGGAAVAGGWALDWDLRWEAVVDCELGVQPRISEERWGGYMGLSYRAARSQAFDEFAFDSEGRQGGEFDLQQFDCCHGQPARWVAYGGKLDGIATGSPEVGGVALLAHEQNHAEPAPWYVWSAGPQKEGFGFVAASFLQDQPMALRRGETLALRYRVIPFAGRPTGEALNAAWEAYRNS